MVTRRKWTIDQLHRLPDDFNRYELVGGELFVTPTPSIDHQLISGKLCGLLDRYVREQRLAVVVSAPNQLVLGDGTEEVQPDLMVIPGDPAHLQGAWKDLPRPLLVVEILSPTTMRRDLVAKRNLYVRECIPAYWIVDEETRSIRAVQLGRDDVIATRSLEWHPSGASAPLVLDVAGLFNDALGPVRPAP